MRFLAYSDGSIVPVRDRLGDDDEGTLHCDLCERIEYADDLTPDWNGETGNHLSCEAAAPNAMVLGLPYRLDAFGNVEG